MEFRLGERVPRTRISTVASIFAVLNVPGCSAFRRMVDRALRGRGGRADRPRLAAMLRMPPPCYWLERLPAFRLVSCAAIAAATPLTGGESR